MSHTGTRLTPAHHSNSSRPKFNGPTKMRTLYIKTSVSHLQQMFNVEDFSGETQLNIPPRLVQTGASITVKDRILILEGHRDQVREALFLIVSKIYKLDQIRGGPCHVCILIPAASRQALIGPDALYHRLVCGFHSTTYSIKPDVQNLELVLKEDMTAAFYANVNDNKRSNNNSNSNAVGHKNSSSSVAHLVGKPHHYEMLPVMLEGTGPVEVCATIMDLAELIGIFSFTRHQERMLKTSLTDARERADMLSERFEDLEREKSGLRDEVAELRQALTIRQAATEDAAGRLQVAYQNLCCERDMWRSAVDQLDCRRRMELLRVGLRLQETETESDALRARAQALEAALKAANVPVPAAPAMPVKQPQQSEMMASAQPFIPMSGAPTYDAWAPQYPMSHMGVGDMSPAVPPGLAQQQQQQQQPQMVIRQPMHHHEMQQMQNHASLQSEAASAHRGNETDLAAMKLKMANHPPGFGGQRSNWLNEMPTCDSINSMMGDMSVPLN